MMDSLGDEPWDVVICGTGLSQSLLALALSRSKKRILHLDPNDYYGGNEAAFSLQEADTWAAAHAGSSLTPGVSGEGEEITAASERARKPVFANASASRHPEAQALGLSFPRAYSLALAPQIIHTRSRLLEQLVSSRAYRQVDFLAVGSFFVYDGSASPGTSTLARIPSSREDVFSAEAIAVRSKRSLMKFLKFVVDYDAGEEQRAVWRGREREPLADFLTTEFRLDESLQRYILALTLTLDGRVAVADGLAAIHRHLTSMGQFGPGFCAVYPKWGGSSEIAQVACRAGAVGGGIYMLDTQVQTKDSSSSSEISLSLSNELSVRTPRLITSQQDVAPGAQTIARLVTIINSPLRALFEVVVNGAPTPAVAVVAFPAGSIAGDADAASLETTGPIYAFVHSSDTGECPVGQSVIYLTTLATPTTASDRSHHQRLDAALDALLRAATPAPADAPPARLYALRYEQSAGGTLSETPPRETRPPGAAVTFAFPPSPLGLAFDDASLDAVRDAWRLAVGEGTGDEGPDGGYMVFEDREGAAEYDDDGQAAYD
ncbi:GDP dissociation inhibitor-domain-containing protein [Durotheca rogersii]|uniref:GDP dissociation inhibitor-domain-containing protein n=1 Tax=Durotheca rogersii TaxID=419775 RepID=UPI00221FFB8C|nr:GDP dissociation inhibitor-domain-containing protein [Durotheca rogersii]KAI5860722.1 GDP dissociation inhibitor-domain-containing protein [Durotheca rogersii]